MVYHLLQHQRQRGLLLANHLKNALETIRHCKRCNNFTEHELCVICQDLSRDFSVLCVVENPLDVAAIEQTNTFKGGYFVLMGKISPLDGVGPEDINLAKLNDLVINEKIT